MEFKRGYLLVGQWLQIRPDPIRKGIQCRPGAFTARENAYHPLAELPWATLYQVSVQLQENDARRDHT